jgi:hypothetical protein
MVIPVLALQRGDTQCEYPGQDYFAILKRHPVTLVQHLEGDAGQPSVRSMAVIRIDVAGRNMVTLKRECGRVTLLTLLLPSRQRLPHGKYHLPARPIRHYRRAGLHRSPGVPSGSW